jgi:DNA-nicking Smr family endonuclease
MNGDEDDVEEAISDSELFRRAMRDVRPLDTAPRALPRKQRPQARARFARAEREAVLAESLHAPGPLIDTQPGDELIYRRPGVSETVLRRLRRGDYRVEAELDLHGLTAAASAVQLAQFLQYARSQRMVCVRIIHGKGLRSGQRGPVLKQTVNTLLRRADPVLAFASARPAAGGTGATLVLLQLIPKSSR